MELLQYYFCTYYVNTGCGVLNSGIQTTIDFCQSLPIDGAAKGQLINFEMSFLCLQFLPKMNENTSYSSRNEFIRRSFGRFHGLTICFQTYLTFRATQGHQNKVVL